MTQQSNLCKLITSTKCLQQVDLAIQNTYQSYIKSRYLFVEHQVVAKIKANEALSPQEENAYSSIQNMVNLRKLKEILESKTEAIHHQSKLTA